MAQRSKRVCNVSGCNEPHHARGLCQKHYDELRKKDRKARRLGKGSPNRDKGRTCSVSGCNRPHHAKGYCKLHYARLAKPKDASEPREIDENNPPDARKSRGRFLNWRLELIRKRHKAVQIAMSEEAEAEEE